METASFCVDSSFFDGESCRLDIYASSFLQMSRSRLKHGIKSVVVDGKKAKLSVKVSGGENVKRFYTEKEHEKRNDCRNSNKAEFCPAFAVKAAQRPGVHGVQFLVFNKQNC